MSSFLLIFLLEVRYEFIKHLLLQIIKRFGGKLGTNKPTSEGRAVINIQTVIRPQDFTFQI